MSSDDQTEPRGAQRNRPVHVVALASTVISVLRDRQTVSAEGLRQFVVDQLLRAVLSRGAFSADALLEELRGYRLQVDSIIDQYVPAVARLLGEQWVADHISFADVTIGTLRLQSLLSEASILTRIDASCLANTMHTLVVVPQNEQHFLGASVVAAQLRRLGCEVSISFSEDHGTFSARLPVEAPDLVLITCARLETLESVAHTVQLIRKALPDGPIIALGGAVEGPAKELKEKTGVDLVTNVAAEAVGFCSEHINSEKSL